MKKRELLKMEDLYATEAMLVAARNDVPVRVDLGWTVYYQSEYSGFARSVVENGILKVALYDHKALRLGGKLPVYEIFMDIEKQQFLTYDHICAKWRLRSGRCRSTRRLNPLSAISCRCSAKNEVRSLSSFSIITILF